VLPSFVDNANSCGRTHDRASGGGSSPGVFAARVNLFSSLPPLDTLGPRGYTGCYSDTFTDRAFDAYAALRCLSTLKIRRRGASCALRSIDGRLGHALRDRSRLGGAIF
jgi:hypothetical protein